MKKPICMKCLQEYRVASIGRMVVYKTVREGEGPIDVTAIMADVHRCPGCKHEIVSSFAQKPLATDPTDVKKWADSAQGAIVVIV